MTKRQLRPIDVDPTEEQEQRRLAVYLDWCKLLWCHVPNGGQRNAVVGAKLKAQGTKRGVPDVLVFTPPPGKFGIVGCAIELKRRNGRESGVTIEQREWLAALAAQGWKTHVAFGADDAIAFVKSLYGG